MGIVILGLNLVWMGGMHGDQEDDEVISGYVLILVAGYEKLEIVWLRVKGMAQNWSMRIASYFSRFRIIAIITRAQI